MMLAEVNGDGHDLNSSRLSETEEVENEEVIVSKTAAYVNNNVSHIVNLNNLVASQGASIASYGSSAADPAEFTCRTNVKSSCSSHSRPDTEKRGSENSALTKLTKGRFDSDSALVWKPSTTRLAREPVDPSRYVIIPNAKEFGMSSAYACVRCGKRYSHRKSLNKHWNDKHQNDICITGTGSVVSPFDTAEECQVGIPKTRFFPSSIQRLSAAVGQYAQPTTARQANGLSVVSNTNEQPYFQSRDLHNLGESSAFTAKLGRPPLAHSHGMKNLDSALDLSVTAVEPLDLSFDSLRCGSNRNRAGYNDEMEQVSAGEECPIDYTIRNKECFANEVSLLETRQSARMQINLRKLTGLMTTDKGGYAFQTCDENTAFVEPQSPDNSSASGQSRSSYDSYDCSPAGTKLPVSPLYQADGVTKTLAIKRADVLVSERSEFDHWVLLNCGIGVDVDELNKQTSSSFGGITNQGVLCKLCQFTAVSIMLFVRHVLTRHANVDPASPSGKHSKFESVRSGTGPSSSSTSEQSAISTHELKKTYLEYLGLQSVATPTLGGFTKRGIGTAVDLANTKKRLENLVEHESDGDCYFDLMSRRADDDQVQNLVVNQDEVSKQEMDFQSNGEAELEMQLNELLMMFSIPSPDVSYQQAQKLPLDSANFRQFQRRFGVTTTEAMEGTGKSFRKRRLRRCKFCAYMTDNVTTLQRHEEKHGGKGSRRCPICDYAVSQQHVLEYHMQSVHRDGTSGRYRCLLEESDSRTCAVETEVFADAAAHSLTRFEMSSSAGFSEDTTDHATVDERLDSCIVPVHTNSPGVAHYVNDVHTDLDGAGGRNEMVTSGNVVPDNRRRKCEEASARLVRWRLCALCGFCSASEARFKRHMLIHPDDRPKCAQCGHRSTTLRLLSRHVARRHGAPATKTNVGKTYRCPDCPFTAPSPSRLANHTRFHGVLLRHACGKCSYSIDRVNLMLQHRRLHLAASDSTSNDYRQRAQRAHCNLCPFKTANNVSLLIHARGHQTSRLVNTRKVYTCDSCGFVANVSGVYARHRKLHARI